MKKRLLGILLAAFICCNTLSLTAMAAESKLSAEGNGMSFATVVLSDYLSETTQSVKRHIGDNYYDKEITVKQVASGSTCTIYPSDNSDLVAYDSLYVSLHALVLKDGVLESSNIPGIRLVGNGYFTPQTEPANYHESITTDSPAKLVFGKNDSAKIHSASSSSSYAPINDLELKAGYVYNLHITSDRHFMDTDIDYYFTIADTTTVPNVPSSSNQFTATPTASKIMLDGKSVTLDAYTINANNYCKIRDVAKLLNGTGKQFEVVWDKKLQAISIISNHAYTPVGGELAKGDGINQTATLNTAKIYLDGKEVSLTAYTINGNNYIKLRDLGQTVDFGGSYDSATGAVQIDTEKGYTPQ